MATLWLAEFSFKHSKTESESQGLPDSPSLKGYSNEADFPRFLHKLVRHRSLFTLYFEPFWFWLRVCGEIRNRKTTRRVGELTRLPIDTSLFKPLNKPLNSPSRGVVFRLRISPWIRSQNWIGSKGSVRNLWGTNFCKNPRKSASLPCPFNDFTVSYFF